MNISNKNLVFLVFIVASLTFVGMFGWIGIYGVFIGVIIGVALTKYSIKKTAEKMLAELITPKPPEEKKDDKINLKILPPEEAEKPKEA